MTRPRGRPRAENPREHAVIVRLTADELAEVDRGRGAMSRAEYIRTRALAFGVVIGLVDMCEGEP